MNYRLLKYELMLLIIFSLLLSFASCNTTEPDIKPPAEPDSTTQNFTFETYEFGEGFSSSYLNDVWIFDENNIWAVGYISPTDTIVNGTPIINPNITRWNGLNWELQPFSGTSCGIEGIWAFDTSLIYFASGNIIKYQNSIYENIVVPGNWTPGQSINKLWGSSKNNIWGIGPNSTIVHYDGVAWSKITFDEGWRFDAITGSKQTEIAYASATSQQFNTIIVELKNNSATVIYNSANDPDNLTSFSLEPLNEQELILGTTSVWTFNIVTKETKVLYSIPQPQYITGISVVSPQDIYFFSKPYNPGENLLHYNGKRYSIINYSDREFVIFGDSHAIKNLAVMTGFSNNKGYLVKVKRQ